MIKSELVQKIAATNPQYPHKVAEQVVGSVFEKIISTLEQANRVELRGFGAFSVKHRPPRAARNPRTGDKVMVGEKYSPAFRTGEYSS